MKRPRLVIFKSNMFLYAQIVNDETHTTLAQVTVKGKTIKFAEELGTLVLEVAKKKHVTAVVFDRGGYRYHGAVKAIAETVRKGGLLV